jgi:hypothetical protein
VLTSRKGNTFINYGGAYPNQTLTVGLPLATDDPILTLKGKKIKITGRI